MLIKAVQACGCGYRRNEVIFSLAPGSSDAPSKRGVEFIDADKGGPSAAAAATAAMKTLSAARNIIRRALEETGVEFIDADRAVRAWEAGTLNSFFRPRRKCPKYHPAIGARLSGAPKRMQIFKAALSLFQ